MIEALVYKVRKAQKVGQPLPWRSLTMAQLLLARAALARAGSALRPPGACVDATSQMLRGRNNF